MSATPLGSPLSGLARALVQAGRLKEAEAEQLLIQANHEKRSLIEVQVREELYGTANQPICIGKKDERVEGPDEDQFARAGGGIGFGGVRISLSGA